MTKLDIWNRALALLPHDRRVTEADDASQTPSTECLRCRDQWDAARVHCLTAHDWGWATRSMAYGPGGNSCAHGSGHVFARPPDALRVVGLFGEDGRRVRATVRDGMFRSDADAAEIRYIPDLDTDDDIEAWPAWFSDAVCWELAKRLAPTILGVQPNRTLADNAALSLAAARHIDAGEVAWSGTDGKTFARARR
jgi:hypothetical protein